MIIRIVHRDAEEFLGRAVELAAENVRSGRGGPFAALVVKDGVVVAEGVNLVTSLNDPTAHAEIVAIRAACAALGSHQLDGCEIYASCEPCPMCFGAIYWARPSRVYYAASAADASEAGFDDSFIYDQLRAPDRAIPMIPLKLSAALLPFELWRSKNDRKPY